MIIILREEDEEFSVIFYPVKKSETISDLLNTVFIPAMETYFFLK